MENSKFVGILVERFNPFMSEPIVRNIEFIKIEATTVEHLF
jgi:hypothetical protein